MDRGCAKTRENKGISVDHQPGLAKIAHLGASLTGETDSWKSAYLRQLSCRVGVFCSSFAQLAESQLLTSIAFTSIVKVWFIAILDALSLPLLQEFVRFCQKVVSNADVDVVNSATPRVARKRPG